MRPRHRARVRSQSGDSSDEPATPNEVAQGRDCEQGKGFTRKGYVAKSCPEVKAMLASAGTHRGLARIKTLAAEARARAQAT